MKQYKKAKDIYVSSDEILIPEITDTLNWKTLGQINDMLIEILDIMRKKK